MPTQIAHVIKAIYSHLLEKFMNLHRLMDLSLHTTIWLGTECHTLVFMKCITKLNSLIELMIFTTGTGKMVGTRIKLTHVKVFTGMIPYLIKQVSLTHKCFF